MLKILQDTDKLLSEAYKALQGKQFLNDREKRVILGIEISILEAREQTFREIADILNHEIPQTLDDKKKEASNYDIEIANVLFGRHPDEGKIE